MNMKKIALALALASASTVALANGWKFAPGLDSSFKFAPTVAATVGTVKQNGGGDSATLAGLELNFNCGLLQSPDNRIRTHFSISRADEKGYDATVIELSPRYTVPLGNGFSVGVGPSLGMVRLEASGLPNENLFAYGVAGGVNYRAGAFYAGFDLNARRTNEKSGLDYDSRGATLKVGFNF